MSVRSVLDDIRRAGRAVLRAQSLEEFVDICSSIGEILSLPGAIPPHSDGPGADVVAWYCVRQDDHDGASMLIDTIPVLRRLTTGERDALASIELPYFDGTSRGRPRGYAPLLFGDDRARWHINYAPWLVPATLTHEQRDALNAFQVALTREEVTEMRLAEMQCLFIDNWRVLHGRAPLVPESRRWLKRAWLRTDRQDSTREFDRP